MNYAKSTGAAAGGAEIRGERTWEQHNTRIMHNCGGDYAQLPLTLVEVRSVVFLWRRRRSWDEIMHTTTWRRRNIQTNAARSISHRPLVALLGGCCRTHTRLDIFHTMPRALASLSSFFDISLSLSLTLARSSFVRLDPMTIYLYSRRRQRRCGWRAFEKFLCARTCFARAQGRAFVATRRRRAHTKTQRSLLSEKINWGEDKTDKRVERTTCDIGRPATKIDKKVVFRSMRVY